MIPLFPELREHPAAGREEADADAEFVITRYMDASNSNLRTPLHRIIRRAGLQPWPKAFQNLRSTRETELAEDFPAHVVCRWIGNSQPVAMRHYLQMTDEHFVRAVRPPARHVDQPSGKATQNPTQQNAECGRKLAQEAEGELLSRTASQPAAATCG